MVIHQWQAHGGVPHWLLQEGVGNLVIVEAHCNSWIQEEVPVLHTGGKGWRTELLHAEYIVSTGANILNTYLTSIL